MIVFYIYLYETYKKICKSVNYKKLYILYIYKWHGLVTCFFYYGFTFVDTQKSMSTACQRACQCYLFIC